MIFENAGKLNKVDFVFRLPAVLPGVDVIVLGTEGTRLGDLQRLAGAQGKVVGVAKSGTSSNSPESQALVESILKGSGTKC